MPTTRERALCNLCSFLREELKGVVVLRNEVLPAIIPEVGLVIIRDGELSEPEVILSPLQYIYQQRIEIEVIVQDPRPDKRDYILDQLIKSIGIALSGNPTLNGAIDFLSIGNTEFTTEAIEGAAAIKLARIALYLEYTLNTLI
ncbi:hypothetical protein I862_04285 [endosymbiont of Acanthamoeba sp. UWC8]|uniref:hypothetical protein n=1 Tax=endosymbiont of Acanthamoeba sp. UWC8 TaxID=86106 RepID=UPI0004D12869|nr:hypothetical protein [endosymbiont of Acanthamoeba sp. UWC8]AIF81417.1 hypothetical protein I862_04285 [endosymbiont of Acanthamoeba sp. UWC8]